MFWYDGKLIDQEHLLLSINEPGFIYGATVFTTMRVYQQSLTHPLTAWSAHCDRIFSSIKVFEWQQPNWASLRQGAELLISYFPVLRMVVFADGKELITGRNLPSELEKLQQQGITAWVATDNLLQRDLAAHKTGNYLSSYLARNQALKLDAQEAIFVDSQGNWLETSTGNLWGWQDGCWYTPALNKGILPGIMRSQLLKHLEDNHLAVQENIWTPEFVAGLEAISYSNCVVGIVPINTILYSGNQFNYSVINFPRF